MDGLQPVQSSRSPLSARAFGSDVLLGELIGRGGMSRVYRAWLRDSGLQVAVKVLRDDLAGRSDAVQRFVRERDLLAAVASPHVVRVHDLVVDGDELGIVMDLVHGGHLRRAVRFPCPPLTAATLTAQIADGLAAVHATGVVHRDLKPENVLVDSDDRGEVLLRLTDFGISRLVDAGNLTQTSVTGTPGYLAPEVAGGARATAAADIYALGVVLYELCTGRGPFVADNPLVLVLAHTRQSPPRPGGMPDALWELVSSMLAKDPAARPPADRVAGALRGMLPVLAGLPACTPPAAPSPATGLSTASDSPIGVIGSIGSNTPPALASSRPRTPTRRSLIRLPDIGLGHHARRRLDWLERPQLLAGAAAGAVIVVLLSVLGVRAGLNGGNAVQPIPTEDSVTTPPTGPTAPSPVLTTSLQQPSGPSVVTLPPVPPGPTAKGSTTAPPSPRPSPAVPTLVARELSADERHSSDGMARLAVSRLKANAGSIASVQVVYPGGSVQVPMIPAGATSYPATVTGLTNGTAYEFTAVVCNSLRQCSRSRPLTFIPYATPEIRAPRLTADGLAVTVTSSPVRRNFNPGEIRCEIIVIGTPAHGRRISRVVSADEEAEFEFTGNPSTTYVATQSCTTDGVSDGSRDSDPITTGSPAAPSASPPASPPPAVGAGAPR